jgi:hypothetical protein
MQHKYGPRGVSFLLLNLSHKPGVGEGEDVVKPWLVERGGADLTAAVEDRDTTVRLHRLAGQDFNTIPSTVLLTRDGKVSDILGIFQTPEFEAALEKIAAT